ncbi:hypothetical protein ACI2JA_03805 [Alkalihalobacillus sp. NPDC078783]
MIVYGAEPYNTTKQINHIVKKLRKDFKRLIEWNREDGYITFKAVAWERTVQ